MKINWGMGLVIGMILFMAFIMYLVITMMTNDRYSHELVTESYYEQDLRYQQEIDAESNTAGLSSKIISQRTEEGLLISFPKELQEAAVEGTVFLYRPSNEALDFDMPFVLSNSQLLIPNARLLDGRWDISIKWSYRGEKYLYKEAFVY